FEPRDHQKLSEEPIAKIGGQEHGRIGAKGLGTEVDIKAGHKPDSVPPQGEVPIIYLGPWLPKGSNRLSSSSGVQPAGTGLHDVSPHRVYLVSLQPNCTYFLLHLSSPYDGRALPAMLHCGVRTFLPSPEGKRR